MCSRDCRAVWLAYPVDPVSLVSLPLVEMPMQVGSDTPGMRAELKFNNTSSGRECYGIIAILIKPTAYQIIYKPFVWFETCIGLGYTGDNNLTPRIAVLDPRCIKCCVVAGKEWSIVTMLLTWSKSNRLSCGTWLRSMFEIVIDPGYFTHCRALLHACAHAVQTYCTFSSQLEPNIDTSLV